jgi:hypothetical protein
VSASGAIAADLSRKGPEGELLGLAAGVGQPLSAASRSVTWSRVKLDVVRMPCSVP